MVKFERCELESFIRKAGTTCADDLARMFRESGEDTEFKGSDIRYIHSLTFSLAEDQITAIYEVTMKDDTHTNIYMTKTGHDDPKVSF